MIEVFVVTSRCYWMALH